MAIGPTVTRTDDSGDSVACYVEEILGCYEELAGFDELKPCPKVDKTFGRLVGLCSQCPGEKIAAMVLNTHITFTANNMAHEGLNRFSRILESLPEHLGCESFVPKASINWKCNGQRRFAAARHLRKVNTAYHTLSA